MCEEEYRKKGIFQRDQRIICRSPFLNITSEENKTGRFFPIRAIRYNPVIIIISNTIYSGAIRSPSVQVARMKRIATFLNLLVLL